VALGEAFVNVRADLKPFAKDLEKGLKTILAAAERKIVADGSTGRGIQAALHKKTEDGVSEGLEEGFAKGMRRGTKEALTTGQKFFAALADFADDGLSAIPGKVKAAILVGVITAAAVAAPFIAGVLSAAITTAVGTGVIAGGIFLAAQFAEVQDQFKALGRGILADLRDEASVFIKPLVRAGELIQESFNRVRDTIGRTFGQAARDVEPLTKALTGFIEEILPGIETAVRNVRPLIEALAVSLPKLGRDIGTAFALISTTSPEAAVALRDFLSIVGALIITMFEFVAALTEVYFWLRVIGAAATGDTVQIFALFAQRNRDAALASGQLTSELETQNLALGQTAQEANAAALAISNLLKAQLKGLDATIDYEQAIDDLAKAINEGNKSFDVREEKGRANLRLVETAVQSAARQRDQEIADMQRTGRSIEEIDAKYQAEIATIEKLTGKNATQNQSLKDLFATARSAPGEVEIEVKTPGLQAALAGFRQLAAAAVRAAQAAVNAINQSSGLQTTKQYAAGDIVTRPTVGLIAEAGYAEAVIPDPAVMPARAMELSTKFGLTSMIADALGGAKQAVNVYIGAKRLEEVVDYRIGYNNQLQAQQLAYGPRGV
jgi:hypothetical protein